MKSIVFFTVVVVSLFVGAGVVWADAYLPFVATGDAPVIAIPGHGSRKFLQSGQFVEIRCLSKLRIAAIDNYVFAICE